MRYDVHQLHMGGYEVVGQVDANDDNGALAAARKKWQGGMRLTKAGEPLDSWPPIEWPPSGALMSDQELNELKSDSERRLREAEQRLNMPTQLKR